MNIADDGFPECAYCSSTHLRMIDLKIGNEDGKMMDYVYMKIYCNSCQREDWPSVHWSYIHWAGCHYDRLGLDHKKSDIL